MSRVIFKRAPPGFRGVRGQIVIDLQKALVRAGHAVPIVDGVYGHDTEVAIAAFQRDAGLSETGQVDEETHWKLMQAGIPDLFLRCLQITADYEGTGFTLANGNFDGQGITWGIVGFTLANGELSAMLRDIASQFTQVFSDSFGSLAGRMREVLAAAPRAQMDFANSISRGDGSRIEHDWEEAFHKLGSDPNVQRIQLQRVVNVYKGKADSDAQVLNLQEELSVGLCFDVSVQNGGLNPGELSALRRNQSGNEGDTRMMMADLVSQRAKPRYRQDVLARKMTFATGSGTVHGDRYALDGWGFA